MSVAQEIRKSLFDISIQLEKNSAIFTNRAENTHAICERSKAHVEKIREGLSDTAMAKEALETLENYFTEHKDLLDF